MTAWNYLEWAAWIGAALLVLWMLWDAIKVSQQYSEDVLTSSQEGVDELIQQNHSKG
ncbi:MAG TPA: hypothetical protein VFE34_13480 [Dongiaceae bacterium]|jgi:hypothetical protein|nr:hypothetical protein [Dongiaceae bacterium]